MPNGVLASVAVPHFFSCLLNSPWPLLGTPAPVSATIKNSVSGLGCLPKCSAWSLVLMLKVVFVVDPTIRAENGTKVINPMPAVNTKVHEISSLSRSKLIHPSRQTGSQTSTVAMGLMQSLGNLNLISLAPRPRWLVL